MQQACVRFQAPGVRFPFYSRFRNGFTLIEVLVAIVVMGVGITVFISFFGSSLALAQSNRYQVVAAQLAGEYLQAVVSAPARYDWHLNPADPNALTMVTAPGEALDVRHPVSLPAALPADHRSNMRDVNLYKQFSWQAYVRVPKPDASYVELTIAIRWNEASGGRATNLGRERVFTLTSCVARSAVPTKTEAVK